MEFINESGLEFTDISSEAKRVYVFPGGDEVIIHNQSKLHVSENGHRIFDKFGDCHYIPNRFIHLYWTPLTGKPHFIK